MLKRNQIRKSSIFYIAYALTIIGLLVLTSCNTSKSMYTSGNYYEAVMQSVRKLKSSPGNKTSKEVLAQAYPKMVERNLDKIDNVIASQSQFVYSESVYLYEELNRIYEAIQHSPAALEVIPNASKYYNELAKIRPLAAEEQYQAGLNELALRTRTNSKKAYYYFQETHSLVPNYKDVSSLIKEAYALSILKVKVDLQPVQSRLYDLSASIFYEEIQKTLQRIEQDEFVQFYSTKDADSHHVDSFDQQLTINFEDFVVGQSYEKERVEKMTSDSVKVGEVTLKNQTKKDVYDVVHAKVFIHKLEVASHGLVRLHISNPEEHDKFLVSQDFPGEYVWYHEWGKFNGDKRALTPKQKAICKSNYVPPIPPQQMFVEFTKPIHASISRRLMHFYKNY